MNRRVITEHTRLSEVRRALARRTDPKVLLSERSILSIQSSLALEGINVTVEAIASSMAQLIETGG
jgi:hypothetical protein